MSNFDVAVEHALAAQSVYDHDRYRLHGLLLSDYACDGPRAVVEAAQDIWEAGTSLDADAVALHLQRAGKLQAPVGGQEGLAGILSAVSMPDPDRLRELSRLRTIRDIAASAMRAADQGNLNEAMTLMAESSNQVRPAGKETLTACGVAEVALHGVMNDRTGRVGLGLQRMTTAIGNLSPGHMLVLGGDTNTAKSSLAIEMLLGLAHDGVTCGLISLEDDAGVTGSRLLSAFSGISSREIQRGTFSMGKAEAFSLLSKSIVRIKSIDNRFLFEDHTGGTDFDVCAAMSRMRDQGARLVVVDYLQEIAASNAQQDRRNEMRWVSKRMKAHARRIGVALVVLSQITVTAKEGERPRPPGKHALKESRDVTNQAEAVVMIWRDEEDDYAELHAKLVKCKWGGVGSTWSLRRNSHTGRLEEL